MNNIINTAVGKVNEDITLEAVRKAQGIIGNIGRERACREVLEAKVKEDQQAITKLRDSELTFEKVYGRVKPANPNTSEATVIKAIEELVKAKQGEIETKASALGQNIMVNLNGIKAIDERVAGMIEELNKVSAKTVDAATLTGNTTAAR